MPNRTSGTNVEDDSYLVQELLEETNLLENIQVTRQKLLREKSLVDSQLQTEIQGQMKALTDGMNSLRSVRENADGAKQTLASMNEVYIESVEHVPGFKDIQSIATIMNNFHLTQRFVQHFETFSKQLETAKLLMKRDGVFDVDNEMPNLIRTHYILSQLRQVREEATSYLKAKDATSDTRLTVRKLYEPLDEVCKEFDDRFMIIAEVLLEILREGNRSLVVRAAKIIEAEERQEFVAQLSQGREGNTNGLTRQGTFVKGTESLTYLGRFLGTIERSIKAQFDNCMSTFPPDTEPKALLENLGFVNSELICAKEDLEPCCPARWNIFNKFVLWYHKGVHRTLATIMETGEEPTPEIMLEVLRYVKDYYATMSRAFGVSRKKTPELLEPPLLDGKERDVYDRYLARIVEMTKKWYKTMWDEERKSFGYKKIIADQYGDGYGFEWQTNVDKLISQQLEVAANSGQARVIAGSVDACCDIIMSRQQSLINLMRETAHEVIHNDREDGPTGIYEHICVVANDQDRAYTFVEQLSRKWSEPMPPRYQGRVIARFEEAREGFQEVTKQCFLINLSIIYADTQKAFRQIFKSKDWYKGVTIKSLINTYKDFVKDARQLLIKELFEIFLGKLCTETIIWYLRAMLPEGSNVKKVDSDKGLQRILDDARMLFEYFTEGEDALDAEPTKKVFRIFDLFHDVLVAPFEKIPDLFRELRSWEHDAPLDLFTAMINLRTDVDSKTLKKLIFEMRAVVVQTEPKALDTEGEEQPHSFLYEFNRIE